MGIVKYSYTTASFSGEWRFSFSIYTDIEWSNCPPHLKIVIALSGKCKQIDSIDFSFQSMNKNVILLQLS